jgi:hypothetical protein
MREGGGMWDYSSHDFSQEKFAVWTCGKNNNNIAPSSIFLPPLPSLIAADHLGPQKELHSSPNHFGGGQSNPIHPSPSKLAAPSIELPRIFQQHIFGRSNHHLHPPPPPIPITHIFIGFSLLSLLLSIPSIQNLSSPLNGTNQLQIQIPFNKMSCSPSLHIFCDRKHNNPIQSSQQQNNTRIRNLPSSPHPPHYEWIFLSILVWTTSLDPSPPPSFIPSNHLI